MSLNEQVTRRLYKKKLTRVSIMDSMKLLSALLVVALAACSKPETQNKLTLTDMPKAKCEAAVKEYSQEDMVVKVNGAADKACQVSGNTVEVSYIKR